MTAIPADPVTAKPRFALLDSTRGLGIILVVYAHFLQSFMQGTAPLVAQQYQFLYSFHMPLFFVLSGMVGQLAPVTLRRNLRGACELLTLVFLMHLLGTGIDLLTRDQSLGWSTPEIFRDGFRTGNASVGVMWFLLSLGLVRLTIGSALAIRTAPLRIAGIAVLLGLFAVAYSQHGRWPVWQDTTLLFASVFFLVGRYLPLAVFLRLAHPALLLVTIPVTVGIALYNLGVDDTQAIVMAVGQYNNELLFVAGALAGTFMCLQLANLLGRNVAVDSVLNDIGRQTLGLLLVNALYCAFLLPLIRLPDNTLDSMTLTAATVGLTLLHIVVFPALKPATDSLIACSNWIARTVTRS